MTERDESALNDDVDNEIIDTTEDVVAEAITIEDAAVAADAPPQYGVGPFSIREVSLLGVWLAAFIMSFLGTSVWSSGIEWILTIGLPTVAVFLIVLRRFSPGAINRFGSLGVDQFASVAFSFSALVWLTAVWNGVLFYAETDVWVIGWVQWVSLVLMVGGVVLTVAAPWIPVLKDDFEYRPEAVAHRVARATRPVVARPPQPKPEPAPAAEPTSPAPYASGAFAATAADTTETAGYGSEPLYTAPEPEAYAPVQAEPEPYAQPTATPYQQPRFQAFWALVPEEREVLDDTGLPIFRVGPTAWALVIEERGDVFVVRHDDGRVGFLHDTSGVTRG